MLWITRIVVLMNLIFTINSLNYTNPTKRVSAAIIGDFKIGFLVSVRLHTPGKKNTRSLECGKVSVIQSIRMEARRGVKVTLEV